MGIVTSMLFYIAVIAIAAFGGYMAQKKDQRYWLLIPILVFSIVAGLRASEVGVDTQANLRAFQACLNYGSKYISREHLYFYIAALLLRIWNNGNLVLMFYALVIYTLVFLRLWDFRKVINLPISTVLFGLFYFGSTMNGLRMWIAMSIVFFVTRYLKKDNYIVFGVCVLAAALSFHVSAVFAILFILGYIGYRKTYTRIQKYILYGCAIAIVPAGVLGFMMYGHYLEDMTIQIGLMPVARLAVLIVSFVLFQKEIPGSWDPSDLQEDNESFKTLFVICAVGSLFAFASCFVEFAGRIGHYFRMFEIVYYSMIFTVVENKKWEKLALGGALLLLGLYYLYSYYGVVPYNFVFCS